MLQLKLVVLAVVAILGIANTNAKKIEITPRIVKGQNAERGQFPFYVYMEVVTSSFLIFETRSACGATLITSEWVITAGHCVSTEDGAVTRLHFGSLRVDDEKEVGREIIEITSKDVFLHENYSSFLGMFNPKNDIALIKLPSPIEFTEYIKSVPLACPQDFKYGHPVLAIGNGISDSGSPSTILQYANLEIYKLLHGNVILAKGLNGESIKSGDSGGPLVAYTDNGDLHGLVGIVSFGNVLNGAQGFTSIGAYFDWIIATTGITECAKCTRAFWPFSKGGCNMIAIPPKES